MARVSLQNVSKIFPGNVKAVDNISLEVADQEFVVLVGPSGCGKSTTLRMIAGLEEATAGDIHIGDDRVNHLPPKDRDIAMVFQNYALYPHMSVYKNMGFGLTLRKYPREEIDRRVREAAQILGISNLLDRKPKALSGGQRQRVAVGRAIVRKPKVFLFDEPLSNLDAKLRVQMRTEISKLHDRLNATMIYVTHDQVEAMTMGDRIVVMKDGVVQQIDPPLALYNNPRNRFVAGFIGSPPMNFMEGRLGGEGGQLIFDEGNLQLAIPASMSDKLKSHAGGPITLGIRPEDVHDPDFARSTGDFATVEAQVEVVEPMGAEIFLYLTTGKSPFIARVDAQVKTAPGERKSFQLDMAKSHWFDANTQQTIL